MYANRFSDGRRFRPATMAAALAINAGVIAALLFANPELIPGVKPKPPMEVINIVEPKPIPEPEPVRRTEPRPAPTPTVVAPERIVDTLPPSENRVAADNEIGLPPATGTETGTGTDPVTLDPPVPPLFVAARQDPRYLADYQPAYPDFERDAGREGVVRLRVRIGVDGRVKQVERIEGRDSFARAAIAHALAKWRFEPATRGGVPEESWKVMVVRFNLA